MTYESILYRRLKQIDVEHLLSGISSREPGWVHESVGQGLSRLFYPLEGSGWLRVGERHYELRPGHLYMLPGDVDQAFGTLGSGSFVFYWTHYRINMADYNLLKELDVPFQMKVKAEEHRELVAHFDRLLLLQQSTALTNNWRAKAVLLELSAIFLESVELERKLEAKQEMIERFDEVLAFIEERLAESLSIEQLAQIACLHPNYFVTMFKSLTGLSPVNYMNERRLELARSLLSDTELPVMDIAERIGMQNHYLSRLFKQQYGITPRRYRELSQSIDGAVQPYEEGDWEMKPAESVMLREQEGK
ncbi:transcriptional regulator, AraC family [Paenibacillus curdlanolyticus YK9]|uniref:Transcriptional regulator, AraC family n=1 Tax=Paenibacillus curdlanolyticus YK9 TaxID=717606 RepID=E0I7H6_9BACL|nr:AraC family transcriptional regulator [Paenibacillus curdlanolyticus]EFM11992.1 transcriptional regulator, AraC family [Paenibacillus curdlanolyticus YK9]